MHPAASSQHNDPLRYSLPLPYRATFFPMGFPVCIATNSKTVLEAATQMWSRFPKLFHPHPMRVNIVVDEGSTSEPLPEQPPVLRGQGHLLSIVAGRANFAVADLNSGFGHICVSREAAGDAAYLRYHFLEPLAYVLIAARHAAFVHASCVALDGRAVLLSGASGSGKTCLAYACARRGWTFLSGDAVAVARAHRGQRVSGRPFEIRFRHTATRLFPELTRFPQVLRPSGKLDIEIDPSVIGLPGAVESTAALLVFLDRATLPVAATSRRLGREAARLELEAGICFGDQTIRARQGRILDRLSRLPSFRLRYSDLAGAETVLRRLLEEHS